MVRERLGTPELEPCEALVIELSVATGILNQTSEICNARAIFYAYLDDLMASLHERFLATKYTLIFFPLIPPSVTGTLMNLCNFMKWIIF